MASPSLRILLATNGSAGDLFPLLPIVDSLVESGHDVQLAVPRFLGLHLRRLGRPHTTIGSGSQWLALRDGRMFSGRFGGWSGWHRVFVDYVTPTLRADVTDAGAVIDKWSPDVVATTALAVAPRLAAAARGMPLVAVSMYPQLRQLTGFARPFVREVAAITGDGSLAWAVGGREVLLHDPALLGPCDRPDGGPAVGYPYWDDVPPAGLDLERAGAWLADRSTPVLAVALGSYVRGTALAERIAASFERQPVRLLLLNAQGAATGALSLVASRCAGVIHHGGIGTMFGALLAGRPSVVIPGPFDQTANARIIERAGAGIVSRVEDLPAAVGLLLDRSDLAAGAVALGHALIPPADAAAGAARILAA